MSYLSLGVTFLVFSSFCLAGLAVPLIDPTRGSVFLPVRSVEGFGSMPLGQLSYKPYEFGYEHGDGLGTVQHRREIADGTGAVRGSYGYVDPQGLNRVVEYKADSEGYKSVIRTNEPGVIGQNSADAVFVVQPPPPAVVAQGLLWRSIPLATV